MLLENVWDYHFDPQTNVIDVHVSRLRQKIDKGFEHAAAAHRARRRLSPRAPSSADAALSSNTNAFRLAALYFALFATSVLALLVFIYFSTADFVAAPDRGDARRGDRAASPSNIRSAASPASSRSSRTAAPRGHGDDARSISSPTRCCIRSPAICRNGRSATPDPARLDPFPVEDPAAAAPARPTTRCASVFVLPGGYRLLVGRDLRDASRVPRAHHCSTLAWSALLTLALGIAGGAAS